MVTHRRVCPPCRRASPPARAPPARLQFGSHLSTQTYTTSPSYAADARRRGYKVNGAFSPRIKTAIFQDDNDTEEQIADARDWLTCGYPERPILIHASRLSVEKRIEHLIAAKPEGATVAIVGDGPQRDALRALHDPANGVCVHVGMVPQVSCLLFTVTFTRIMLTN